MAARRSQQIESYEILITRRDPSSDTMGKMRSWSHWTGKGVFEIRAEFKAGSWTFALWFNDRLLDRYFYLDSACASISAGDWDDALGFKASALGVPTSPDDWKGLR
jgi:hypothetical protein